MTKKDDNRSMKELSQWLSEQQKKSDIVKTEEQEHAPVKNLITRRRTRSMCKRSSPPLDESLSLKSEVPDASMQTDTPETTTTEDPAGTFGLWRGNDVGREVKKLLEAVEHRYPNTFLGVQIRVKSLWSTILKELHATIKSFMGTSFDALVDEEITGFREDFEVFKKLGFDLSWAYERLDMVEKLKFGNEPLQKELMALEESLVPLQETVDERLKQLMEAHEMWNKAKLDHENATDARNKKADEFKQTFGAEFDSLVKGRLGFGMLPGY